MLLFFPGLCAPPGSVCLCNVWPWESGRSLFGLLFRVPWGTWAVRIIHQKVLFKVVFIQHKLSAFVYHTHQGTHSPQIGAENRPHPQWQKVLYFPNTQVPSSDIITSLCGYSSVSEAWKVFVYVNSGASAICDA